MWSSVLGVALLLAIDPVRIGVILVLLSRARPVQNLIAYWVGCLIIGIPSMLVPLIMLHRTSVFGTFGRDLATPATDASATMRHIQIGMGVITLLIAALMTVRYSARPRAAVSASAGGSSTLVDDRDIPADSPASAESEGNSLFRRLLRRVRKVWESGAWWVSLVIGIGSGPPAPLVLVVLSAIVASGAAVSTQVGAALVFVVGMFAVVEIILVSYLVAPAKTQAALQFVHDLLRPHRRKIFVGVVVVVGLFLLASGTGIL